MNRVDLRSDTVTQPTLWDEGGYVLSNIGR